MRESDFERLYTEHAQPLFGFLVYRTGDRELAQDILADTFEAAYKARSRFDRRRASERTWLYSIALNRVRDNARRQAAESRALEDVRTNASVQGGVDVLERIELRVELLQAMRMLSEVEREALALRFGADLTLEQVASTLGVPRTTVEGRVYRALRLLRDELG